MSSKKLLFNAISTTPPGQTETISLTIRPTSANGSSWQNTSYVYDGNTNQAATVSISRTNYSTRYLTANFSSINIPENAQITSAILTVIAKQSSSTSTRRITVYADVNGNQSNRIINQQLTNTNNTTLTADISDYIRNLTNLKITGAITGSSTSSQTFSIYEIYIDVVYTVQTTEPDQPEPPIEDGWIVINGANGQWGTGGLMADNSTIVTDLIDISDGSSIYMKIQSNNDNLYFKYLDMFDSTGKYINYLSQFIKNDPINGVLIYEPGNPPLDSNVKYIGLEIGYDTTASISPNDVTIYYKKVEGSDQPEPDQPISLTIRPTSANGSSWQNIANAYDNNVDTVSMVQISNTNYASRYLTVDFSNINIPENAQITSATLTVIARQRSSTSNVQVTVYTDVNGDESNRIINQKLTTDTNATLTADISNYIKDLSSLKITGYMTGGAYPSQELYIHEIYIDVTYTTQTTEPEPEPPVVEGDWTVINGANGYWDFYTGETIVGDEYESYYLTTDLIDISGGADILINVQKTNETDVYYYGLAGIGVYNNNSFVESLQLSDFLSDSYTLQKITNGDSVKLLICKLDESGISMVPISPNDIVISYKKVYNSNPEPPVEDGWTAINGAQGWWENGSFDGTKKGTVTTDLIDVSDGTDVYIKVQYRNVTTGSLKGTLAISYIDIFDSSKRHIQYIKHTHIGGDIQNGELVWLNNMHNDYSGVKYIAVEIVASNSDTLSPNDVTVSYKKVGGSEQPEPEPPVVEGDWTVINSANGYYEYYGFVSTDYTVTTNLIPVSGDDEVYIKVQYKDASMNGENKNIEFEYIDALDDTRYCFDWPEPYTKNNDPVNGVLVWKNSEQGSSSIAYIAVEISNEDYRRQYQFVRNVCLSPKDSNNYTVFLLPHMNESINIKYDDGIKAIKNIDKFNVQRLYWEDLLVQIPNERVYQKYFEL